LDRYPGDDCLRAGEYQLVVLPARQGQDETLGPEVSGGLRVDRNPPGLDLGPNPTLLANVPQVGHQAVADVNGSPNPSPDQNGGHVQAGPGPAVSPDQTRGPGLGPLWVGQQEPEACGRPAQDTGHGHDLPGPGR